MSSSDTFASFLFYSYDWTEEPPSSPPKLRFNKGRYILPLRLAKQLLQTPPDFPDDSLVMEAIEEPPPEPPPADRKDEPVPRGILDDMTDTARGILDSGMLDSTLLSARAGLDATRSFLRSPVSSTRAFVKETLLPSAIPFLAAYGPYLVHYAIDYSGEYFQKQSFSSFLGPSTPQHREDPMAAVGSAIALPPTPPHPPDEKGGVFSQLRKGIKAIDPFRFPGAEAAQQYQTQRCSVTPDMRTMACETENGEQSSGDIAGSRPWAKCSQNTCLDDKNEMRTIYDIQEPDKQCTISVNKEKGAAEASCPESGWLFSKSKSSVIKKEDLKRPNCHQMEDDPSIVVCKDGEKYTKYTNVPPLEGEICTARTNVTTIEDEMECVDPWTGNTTSIEALERGRNLTNGTTIDKRIPPQLQDIECVLDFDDNGNNREICIAKDPTRKRKDRILTNRTFDKSESPVKDPKNECVQIGYAGWTTSYKCKVPDGDEKYDKIRSKLITDKRPTQTTSSTRCEIDPTGLGLKGKDPSCAAPKQRFGLRNPQAVLQRHFECTGEWESQDNGKTYTCTSSTARHSRTFVVDDLRPRDWGTNFFDGVHIISQQMQGVVSWDDTTLTYSIPITAQLLSGTTIQVLRTKERTKIRAFVLAVATMTFMISTWASLDLFLSYNTSPYLEPDPLYMRVFTTAKRMANVLTLNQAMVTEYEVARPSRIFTSMTLSWLITQLFLGTYWTRIKEVCRTMSSAIYVPLMIICLFHPFLMSINLIQNDSFTFSNVIGIGIEYWCTTIVPIGLQSLLDSSEAVQRQVMMRLSMHVFLSAAVGAARTEMLKVAMSTASLVTSSIWKLGSTAMTYFTGGASAVAGAVGGATATADVSAAAGASDSSSLQSLFSVATNYCNVMSDIPIGFTHGLYVVSLAVVAIICLTRCIAWYTTIDVRNNSFRSVAQNRIVHNLEIAIMEFLFWTGIGSLIRGGTGGLFGTYGFVTRVQNFGNDLHTRVRNIMVQTIGTSVAVLGLVFGDNGPNLLAVPGLAHVLLLESERIGETETNFQQGVQKLYGHVMGRYITNEELSKIAAIQQIAFPIPPTLFDQLTFLGEQRAQIPKAILAPPSRTTLAITASGGGGGAADTTITQTALKAFQLFCYWKQLDEEEDYDEEEVDHVRNNILYYRGLFLYHRVRIHETLRKYNILVNKFSKADIAKIAEEAQNLIIGLNNGDNSENLEFKGKMEEIGREGYNDTTDTLENLAERAERDSLEVSDEHSSGDGSIQI